MRRYFCGALFLSVFSSSCIAHTVTIESLPLGSKVSTSAKQGYIWSCLTNFTGAARAQGAGRQAKKRAAPFWIHGDTYNLMEKPVIEGAVTWPSKFDVTINGNRRVITGNNLPDHPTGVFPVARDSKAHAYDPNPNPIKSQNFTLVVDKAPLLASAPSCVPMGPIGFMLTGSVIYNGLDAGGQDAVAYELMDQCDGHTEITGTYHYHNLTSCIADKNKQTEHSTIVGYALDGFGIYGLFGEKGQLMSNDDLDACHGHTHVVAWDGVDTEIYHYHMTLEYPYSVGCFKGTPSELQGKVRGRRSQHPDRPHRQPPPRRPPPGL